MSTPPSTPGGWGLEAGRLAKAQVASGVATGADWLLMTVLIWAGVYYLIAAVFGAAIGAATDFSLKKWWVFAAHAGLLRAQALRYLLVSALSAGFNCLIAYGLVDGIGLPPTPGVIVASVIVALAWNYPMHRLFVFARQRAVALKGADS